MVNKAIAILVIGVGVAVAGGVFMSINMSANVTGWSATTTNFYRNIIPLVIFAGVVLVIIGALLYFLPHKD